MRVFLYVFNLQNEQLDPSHLKPMEGVEKRASRQPAMRLLHKRKLAPHVTIIFDSHNEPWSVSFQCRVVLSSPHISGFWLSSLFVFIGELWPL